MYKALIRERNSHKLTSLPTDSPTVRCLLVMHGDRTWSPVTDVVSRIAVNEGREVDLASPPRDTEVLMVYETTGSEGEQAMIAYVQNFGYQLARSDETLRSLRARAIRADIYERSVGGPSDWRAQMADFNGGSH